VTVLDLVSFSGGLGSWAAAKLRRQSHPDNTMILLFADTKFEDQDLYRFLPQAAANVGAELVTIADGRDIWQVFCDERMLGNTRADPCSKILKRRLLDRWRDENCKPDSTTLVLGYGSEEGGRVERHGARLAPWRCVYPVYDAKLSGYEVLAWCEREGLDPPRLYDLGFEHNNCKGGCVKAGVSSFVHLYRTLPGQFQEWVDGEERVRKHLGRTDISILRDRRGGVTTPMPLMVLAERIEAGEEFPRANRFACGCMSPDEE
jgi:hypothetical protein